MLSEFKVSGINGSGISCVFHEKAKPRGDSADIGEVMYMSVYLRHGKGSML